MAAINRKTQAIIRIIEHKGEAAAGVPSFPDASPLINMVGIINTQINGTNDAEPTDNQSDQKRPQAALQIFAEMGKVELRETLEVLVLPRPEPGDEPAHNDDGPNDWNKHANAAEQEIHHPFWALEKIGDGGGVVHGQSLARINRSEARFETTAPV